MSSQQESGNFFGSKTPFKRGTDLVPQSIEPHASKFSKFIRSTPRPLREAAAALLTLATINGGASMVDTHAQTPPPQPLQGIHEQLKSLETTTSTTVFSINDIEIFKDPTSGIETTAAIINIPLETNQYKVKEQYLAVMDKDNSGKTILKNLTKLPIGSLSLAMKKDPVEGQVIVVGGSEYDPNYQPGDPTKGKVLVYSINKKSYFIIDAKDETGKQLGGVGNIKFFPGSTNELTAEIADPENEFLPTHWIIKYSNLTAASIGAFKQINVNGIEVSNDTQFISTTQNGETVMVSYGKDPLRTAGYYKFSYYPATNTAKVENLHPELGTPRGEIKTYQYKGDNIVTHVNNDTKYPGSGERAGILNLIKNDIDVTPIQCNRPLYQQEITKLGGVGILGLAVDIEGEKGYLATVATDLSDGFGAIVRPYIEIFDHNDTTKRRLIKVPIEGGRGDTFTNIDITKDGTKKYLTWGISRYSVKPEEVGVYRTEIVNGNIPENPVIERLSFVTEGKANYQVFIPIVVKGAQ